MFRPNRWAFLTTLTALSCATPTRTGPVIAASLPPLASMAEFLAGDRFTVVCVLPPGRSEHDFEPTPREIDQARGAVLFAYTHEDMDGWMLRVAKGVMGESPTLVSMQDSPRATGKDPHLWLDLDVVKDFVPRLAEKLAEKDPSGSDTYRARATAYLDSLVALDAEARALLEPVAEAPFAILHPAFEVLARRYDLNLVAVLEEHPEAEALPRTLGEATLRLRASGARVVFGEPQLPTRLTHAIAADLGAKTALLDPLGGPGIESRETYLELMRWNVQQLAENL